jgi:hypothetical protein
MKRAYNLGELMDDEDSLAHFGVKGMKWGQRKARDDGATKSRGRVIDRNEKARANIEEHRTALKEGGGSIKVRVANRVNRMTMGKRMTEKHYDRLIEDLNSQTDRLRKGELTLGDRFDVVMSHPATRIAGAALEVAARRG